MPKNLFNTVWNHFCPPCKVSQSFNIWNFEDFLQSEDQNYHKAIELYLSKQSEKKPLTSKDHEFLYVVFKFLTYLHLKFDLYFLHLEIQNNAQGYPITPLRIELKIKSQMEWNPTFLPRARTDQEIEAEKKYFNKFEQGTAVNSNDKHALQHLRELFPEAIIQQDNPQFRGTIDTCEHCVSFTYKSLKNIIYSLKIPEQQSNTQQGTMVY